MHHSERMRRVRSSGTAPELAFRKLLYANGVRYRVNYRALTGSPDIYIPRLKLAIFIHGCFWHKHDCRHGRRRIHTNLDYWAPKLARNVARDAEVLKELHRLGVTTVILWACTEAAFPVRADLIAKRYHGVGTFKRQAHHQAQGRGKGIPPAHKPRNASRQMRMSRARVAAC